MLLKSGDASQEFFDGHISKVHDVLSGVKKACFDQCWLFFPLGWWRCATTAHSTKSGF